MSKVETVRVIDKRIEPQPDPLFAVTVSPQQNQFYKIPASGRSNSYVTFNNLTTLGADRAYLDTFELEITATVTFNFDADLGRIMQNEEMDMCLPSQEWCFDSFPFNKCCEEIRVNINGGAFFSSPLSYLRAKERYWDDRKILEAYGNVCPCNKPWLANELGVCETTEADRNHIATFHRTPSRLNDHNFGYACTAYGPHGTTNHDMITPYRATVVETDADVPANKTFTCTWREPIFCSPFSSRIDGTYGRPLYNITSIDLAFNLQNLCNMIRCRGKWVSNFTVNLDDINLCYQVMTLPPGITRPPSTVVPYRRFVPYITDYPANPVEYQPDSQRGTEIEITSGVYTLNEIPQAVWIFLAPTKAGLQQDPMDGFTITPFGGLLPQSHTWTFNKGFGQLEHISISCANTTQILNTASVEDLYRIAKANGCQDTFVAWANQTYLFANGQGDWVNPPGSVLRLIPGTDIVIDQPLIPGANANNMVFQVSAKFRVPSGFPPNYRDVALWLLFEYNGVATITPGQCMIEMNPLANTTISPSTTISANADVETTEGGSWIDKLVNIGRKVGKIAKETKLASQLANYIPGIGPTLSKGLAAMGYGSIGGGARKRPAPDYSGGAVMGYGDFC